MTEAAVGDFETRSVLNLKQSGAWKYSKDPSTEVLCFCYILPDEDIVKLWHMAHPQYLIAESDPPQDLFDFLARGGLLEAHNVFFDKSIWKNKMMPLYGWPEVKHEQWRCSAAKAAAWGLPRDLERAAKAAGLPIEKDMEGRRLMLKMCKPRKPKKAEVEELKAQGKDPNKVILWHEEENDIYRIWDYCKTDVLTEKAFGDVVPELSEYELQIWQADQALNERGLLFDTELAKAALDMASRERKRLNNELKIITGIESATKRQKIKEWLVEHENVYLPDTKADTLKYYKKFGDLSGRARKIVDIIISVNKTSTRKYKAVLDKVDTDGRIRDLLMYHGAGTGRWSGKGVQIQNFPSRNLVSKDFDGMAEDIKSGHLEWCQAMYGDVMFLLSSALRGLIISPPDKDLIVADYASIEARFVLWLAGAMRALKVFETGDIYCDMATGIYGYEVLEEKHYNERQLGKQAILGLGYQMGFLTFLLTCRGYGIYFSREDVLRIMGAENLGEFEEWVKFYLFPDVNASREDKIVARQAANRLIEKRERPADIVHELALMKYIVGVYRSRYPEVVQMWKDQEAAAIRAIEYAGVVRAGKVSWYKEDNVLYCVLPSGRRIAYQAPLVTMKKTSWGEKKKTLSYMSVNGITRKWERTYTYGGKIVENITQGSARDAMAHAMLNAEKGGIYSPALTVHDELGCEVDRDKGSISEYELLMAHMPMWTKGCPIVAKAKRFTRYRKL